MGLFSKLKSPKSPSETSDSASTFTQSSTTPLTKNADSTVFQNELSPDPSNSNTDTTTTNPPRKTSLYAKYAAAKRGPGTSGLSDEDLLKYTGKTRAEFDSWKKDAPGVAGNQAAGSVTAGGRPGLGMEGVAEGRGGWGFEAGKIPGQEKRKGKGKDEVIR